MNPRSFLATGLSVVRRREPWVIWTPAGIGLGNFAYGWLQAHRGVAGGAEMKVLETRDMRAWQSCFPRVFDELVIQRRSVPFRSKRVDLTFRQAFGTDFLDTELEAFIDHVLLYEDSPFESLTHRHADDAGLTVNVRRGDYYTNPHNRGLYSFDVVEYVRVAVEAAFAKESFPHITVVSDDLQWCAVKLDWLRDFAPVRLPEESAGADRHLAILAGSRNLVLANSTFSYWGAHLSNRYTLRVRGVPNHDRVWAPWFHSRRFPDYRAHQLDPRWRVLDEIPGGWDG